MKPLLTYKTLFDPVEFEIVSVVLDDRDLPYSQISKTEQAVALHQAGRGEWDVATLRLRAVLPDEEIANGPWSDVVCAAVLTENSTNARSVARLTKGHDGSWHGKIELVRGRHFRRAVLSLVVAGEVDGIPGRSIGGSETPWYIDLKESTPRRQREIRIEEVDFRESSEEWLRAFKDSTWVVATVNDPEVPIVYLNKSAVEGLVEILNGTGGTIAEKVLRDMTVSQIAQDAWTAMFHTAVSDLEQDDDGTPIMPTGWREPVLTMMLPDVLPSRQLTDALREINECRTSGVGWPELQTNIQFAAGKRSQIAKKLTGAVRMVDREERTGS